MHEIQMLGLLEHDVLSSIEVPYLSERTDLPTDPTGSPGHVSLTKADADKFDLDTFASAPHHNTHSIQSGGISSTRVVHMEKRPPQRHSVITRIDTIEESPRIPLLVGLPPETTTAVKPEVSGILTSGLSISPSQSSILSTVSEKSTSSKTRTPSNPKGSLASKLTPSWLFNPFRSSPSEPQMSDSPTTGEKSRIQEKSEKNQVSEKHAKPITQSTSRPIQMPPPKATVTTSTQPIQPVTIRHKIPGRTSWTRLSDDDSLLRGPYARRSPLNTPPSDGIMTGKRRSMTSGLSYSFTSSTSPGTFVNPTKPQISVTYSQAFLARRWQHIFPKPIYKHEIKWKPIVTPGCLPLTVEHFPSSAELDSSYDVFSYEFILDPAEMRSFLVRPQNVKGSSGDDLRRAWALVVMRGMAAVRLAQGFQFILRRQNRQSEEEKPVGASAFRRSKSFVGDDDLDMRPAGAAEVLTSTTDPVYLSMTNEIHRISYTGEAIQVRRYVRRMSACAPIHYKCLIWPKLGGRSFRCCFCEFIADNSWIQAVILNIQLSSNHKD